MRLLLIICISFFLFSCSTKSYNTPFINSDETTKLEFGMSKERVLTLLNSTPLFVESGDLATVIWVYEVRTIEVKSNMGSDGLPVPAKTSRDTKHATPIHRLQLVFDAEGRLMSWGPYEG